MLNIVDATKVSVTPMNYYMKFKAEDSESELEMALRINAKQSNKLVDIALLSGASGGHIDIPVEIPVEILRTQDAGDGLNSIDETLSSKVVWLAFANGMVTISVAGYAHAIRMPQVSFMKEICKLYRELTDLEIFALPSYTTHHPQTGAITVFCNGSRCVVRHQDMMLVATYGRNKVRLGTQPMAFYVQDTEGLWMHVSASASKRWSQFVSEVATISF